MNSETDRPDDEAAFERFINDRFGPEALAHIKASRPPIEGTNGRVTINGRDVTEPADANDEAAFDRNGDLFKPHGIIINIDPSVYEALKKFSADFGDIIPPVDTGTLRQSLNYGRMAEMYRQHFEAEANRRRQLEEEAERIRRRMLMTPNGEAFLARVDAFAEANGVEWVDAARICSFADLNDVIANAGAQLAKAINGMFNSSAFEAFIKDTARMIEEANIAAQTNGSIVNPRNRHERRAKQHKKPLKDSDQQWKRRNYRNRRNH